MFQAQNRETVLEKLPCLQNHYDDECDKIEIHNTTTVLQAVFLLDPDDPGGTGKPGR